MKLLTTIPLIVLLVSPAVLLASPSEKNKIAEKNLGLSKNQSVHLAEATLKKQLNLLRTKKKQEFDAKTITLDGKSMRFEYRTLGKAPKDGHSLYISLHGGGNAPARINDGQWKNQINLYTPKEGIYVAPRAPTNTWNLWHEAHIDPLFDRMIADFIAFKGINPNKVYILGYSAGGDGLYQLAPRMADRWAAAAMMAGHPGDAQAYNLRNLPFFIQCGGKDSAYKRNELCAAWGKKLDKLSKTESGAYPHKCIVYPKFGHWMNGKDAAAIPWMAKYTRNPWPKEIQWYQDDITHKRFYWLENDNPKAKQLINAKIKNQTITLTPSPATKNQKGEVRFTAINSITLRLSDQLLNLDEVIVVKNNKGKVLFKGKVARTKNAIIDSIKNRPDLSSVATATLKVKF
jgi:poly(3-hydroxybutyrate) depolymerase